MKIEFKKLKNYITLSLKRIVAKDNKPNELVHLSAVRFENDRAKEYIDIYVENSKWEYNEKLNKKAYPFLYVISCLHSWLEKDIIILHEGGRKDIEWLSEELNKNFNLTIENLYVNLEDLAVFKMHLKKTSLKDIAKHFGVYRVNSNKKISRDSHNCMLIHEIWKAYKERYC